MNWPLLRDLLLVLLTCLLAELFVQIALLRRRPT